MKTSSYRERDYAFGQIMLTLRTEIGLTQDALAKYLGVSRRTVGEWEGGNSYPKAEHLKEVIALAVQNQAFPKGSEAEEVRAVWKAGHQKVLLDERWLSALLEQQHSRHLHLVSKPVERTMLDAPTKPPPPSGPRASAASTRAPEASPRVHWGDEVAVSTFYGREQEKAMLSQWVVQEHCQVMGVLGIGGIGKSALSVSIMYQLARHFEVVIFRSLRDAPTLEALLADCLQTISLQPLGVLPAGQAHGQAQGTVPTEQCISLLLSHLRSSRTLLVLDNLECLLQQGDVRGHFRPGFEGYGLLLRRVAETVHRSCLIFTSREKPADIRLSESISPSVRSLRLTGLDAATCKQILAEKIVIGTEAEQERLVELYAGNPLALKIVAETIVDLFGGEIGLFLNSETLVFGSISDLLDEQFVRLSALEQSVLYWLAIMREPVTLDELLKLLVTSPPRVQVLEALDGLHRRSLIERGKRLGSLTLQSVVLEYVTGVLIVEGSRELKLGCLHLLIEHGLSQAHAKEYVRKSQERLLVSPLLANLQNAYQGQSDRIGLSPAQSVSVEEQLLRQLKGLRELTDTTQGYGPANLIALLRMLRGNLNALDLSHLCIREVYLQDIEMQDASMAGSLIQDCVWTSAVDVAWAVAMGGNGKWWASGGIQGQVRVWEGVHPHALHLNFQAHTDFVYALAFSRDGRFLASGSQDGTIKLWDLEACSHGASPRDALLWTARQSFPLSLAFSPDGLLLASGELHATIRIFDPQSGRNLQTLTPPSDVWAITWSPDGSLLASGGKDGEIRLWERQKRTDLAFTPYLSMQTNWVSVLSFSPDGRMLVSTSWGDQTVKLWEVGCRDEASPHPGVGPRGQLLHTLPGYADQSRGIAWSPDGRTLAYSNPDKGIRLWDVEEGRYRGVLRGHNTDIYGVAFTPDGTRLFSGSSDGTLRVWDLSDYRCMRVIQGYGVYLYDLAWSPDGTHLISGDTNGQVTIWDLSSAMPSKVLYSHTWIVEAVGWSPDGQYFASCGLDGLLCLWNPTSHTLVQKFENSRLLLLSMAWSPNGKQLACGTYGQGIQVWDVTTRSHHFVGQTHPVAFWCIDWSPNGTQLVGGGHDGCLYLWKCTDRSEQAQGTAPATTPQEPTRLPGHHSRITSVAWSPNGKWLASSSGTSSNGELFVWDVEHAVRVQTLEGHPSMVYALAWSRCRDGAGPQDRDQLISAGADGKLYWWNVETAECINIQDAHQGTIRSLKVSPDGQLLASCGDDGAIKIWDLTRNAHLLTLRRSRPYERLNITGIRGLTEAEIASLHALGAIEEVAPFTRDFI
jgi:WD40 repeat protein/transcriptional regulator with XRE-family HTH domain